MDLLVVLFGLFGLGSRLFPLSLPLLFRLPLLFLLLLSTLFDVGGIAGGIAAGLVSDATGKSASTCAIMLVAAIPSVRSIFILLLNGTVWITSDAI